MRWIYFSLLSALAFPVFGNEAETTHLPPAEKSLKEWMVEPEDGTFDGSEWLSTAREMKPEMRESTSLPAPPRGIERKPAGL